MTVSPLRLYACRDCPVPVIRERGGVTYRHVSPQEHGPRPVEVRR